MKNWDFKSDDARCTGRDRGVSGLLVNGAVSGDQALIHIAERRRVGNSGKEHVWDQRVRLQDGEEHT